MTSARLPRHGDLWLNKHTGHVLGVLTVCAHGLVARAEAAEALSSRVERLVEEWEKRAHDHDLKWHTARPESPEAFHRAAKATAWQEAASELRKTLDGGDDG